MGWAQVQDHAQGPVVAQPVGRTWVSYWAECDKEELDTPGLGSYPRFHLLIPQLSLAAPILPYAGFLWKFSFTGTWRKLPLLGGLHGSSLCFISGFYRGALITLCLNILKSQVRRGMWGFFCICSHEICPVGKIHNKISTVFLSAHIIFSDSLPVLWMFHVPHCGADWV